MKKKIILSSVLTIVLCLSLIAGSTFALFTSESKVNVAVTSGTVKVLATADEPVYGTTLRNKLPESEATLNENTVTLNRMVPGDFVTFNITISNESDVSVKYRTVISKVADNGLWEALSVEIGGEAYNGATKKTEWATLEPGSEPMVVSVKVALPETATNAYQGKTCSFAYTVEAVQANAEVASEWDGISSSAPTTDENGVYHIATAAQFVEFMASTQNVNSSYLGKQIVLDTNIDFNGLKITGVGNSGGNFSGNFDGQGYTVSNFTIENNIYYGGLFNYAMGATIQNLTVKDATVIGTKQVGALVGGMDGDSKVENCVVENCTVMGEKKVGGGIGYMVESTVDGLTVKNVAVYAGLADEAESGEAIGFVNSYGNGCTTDGVQATDVTVTRNASFVANGVLNNQGVYEISNAAGMFWFADQVNVQRNSFAGKTLKLTANINLNRQAWEPLGQTGSGNEFKGTFDGNGKTISGLNVNVDNTENSDKAAGLFGWLSTGTVKNVTLDGATVKGSHYVGAVVGYNQFGKVDNCTVKNSSITGWHLDSDACGDKVGGVCGQIGPNSDVGVTNCHVENTTVQGGRDAGQVIGMAYPAVNELNGNTATNVTVSATEGCTGANITNGIIGRQ